MATNQLNYLIGLQEGYRVEDLVGEFPSGLEPYYIIPFNPFRVTLFVVVSNASQPVFEMVTLNGTVIQIQYENTYILKRDWIKDPHLVYLEHRIIPSASSSFKGFQVIKTPS